MTDYLNCCNQQPPSYAGVTINITNPALNMQSPVRNPNGGYYNAGYEMPYIQTQYPQQYQNMGMEPNSQYYYGQIPQYQNMNPVPYNQYPYGYLPQGQMVNPGMPVNNNGEYNAMGNNPKLQSGEGSLSEPVKGDYNSGTQNINTTNIYQTAPTDSNRLPNAYPQQYYLNNHESGAGNGLNGANTPANIPEQSQDSQNAQEKQDSDEEVNTDTSKEIIAELDERNEKEKELEKNGKKTKIVALTNEYIMSLENYLNNPNTDIRLMAAKEILTRLDEDRDRYDDAALNALLNKMLQDPNKLVRIAALSAFSSDLASGNDYTVQLLNQIQQNPEADPEDVLEASQILLKRAANTEVRYAPANSQQSQPEVNEG